MGRIAVERIHARRSVPGLDRRAARSRYSVGRCIILWRRLPSFSAIDRNGGRCTSNADYEKTDNSRERCKLIMSVVDVNSVLTEVSAESPAGDNLEYDEAFREIESAAQRKPEQMLGDVLSSAEPPDWRAVRNQAIEILGRTKDLRIGVYLTRALVNTDGYAGLADGLALIRGLLDRYWDTVYPLLEIDGEVDPDFRVNAISALCDRQAVLKSVLDAPLASSRALGRFGLRSIDIAKGEASARDDEPATDMATIEAAFMDADLEELQATHGVLERCNGDLAAIDAVLTERLGASQAPDLGALSSTLKRAQTVLNEQLSRRGAGAAADAGEMGASQDAGQVPQHRPVSGEIRSREDAIRMMDKISDYFQHNEPSSPVPLLMNRAKRLVSMNFIDILRDLAPDGVSQAESVGGLRE